MGKGAQGDRKGDVEACEVMLDKKGFLLTAKIKDKKETAVARSEADLIAFHRGLVENQCKKYNRERNVVEAELGFPLAERNDILAQGLMGLCGLVACAAAIAKTMNIPFIAVDRIGFPVEFVALGIAVLCMVTLSVTKSSKAQVAPLKAYMNRVLRLEGADAAFLALLEEPQRPDWPARLGPIDLTVHDLPHSSSQTEWWYYSGHAQSNTGRPLSLFICFFRIIKHVDKFGNKYYMHALTWAVSDVENKKYYSDVILDKDCPAVILQDLQKKNKNDPILMAALSEVLKKGNVPLPDRLFTQECSVSKTQLKLNYENGFLEKTKDGSYHLKATHYNLPCSIDVTFTPQKVPMRHGADGVVKGRNGDDMFYYCISRCELAGSITVPLPRKKGSAATGATVLGETLNVRGNGWYDHEFGGKPEAEWVFSKPEDAGKQALETVEGSKFSSRYAWNWAACQLNDNTEITAAVLYNADSEEVMEKFAVFVNAHGETVTFDMNDGIEFAPVESKRTKWRSVRTFREYPTAYKLVVPQLQVDLTISACFEDQEFMTILTSPGFWEGRCDVVGTKEGKPINGLAFVERNGFGGKLSIKEFFKAVGHKVRESVKTLYPLRPTYEEGVQLIASEKTQHYMKGVPLDVIGDTLIAPVRLVADRGGKSWRSYGALACVDCVGGDSRDFVDWLAMPEFLHVGSLIVDDIQDKSETRRGGPSAHLQYGEPLCINAGTAAYFQCEQLLKTPGLTAEELNECYSLYFSALRGGHAGQALDINGLDYMMDDVVATGNAELLEERLLAIHMLKTAVPAGTLARMGALVGKGTEDQVEAMGLYFESVGIAFQIMDDVLNLRGLYANESDKLKVGAELKNLGEDISCGKVTMPVAKAMALLKSKEDREKLWNTIKSKPSDKNIVADVINQLEQLGAIQACVTQAESVVDEAWGRLDSVIPDSFAKIMLRSFGNFVIERSQ